MPTTMRLNLSKFSASAVRWKLRQLYGRARALQGGGVFVYSLGDGRRFAVLADDRFSEVLYVIGGHEATETDWCRLWMQAGDFAIDCGANIGFWSASLAQSVEGVSIVAVEGNAATADKLRLVLGRLGLTRVAVHEGILAESDRERLVLPSMKGREPWQRVRQDNMHGSCAVTLDSISTSYGAGPPSLVKIDCEGYEVRILRGAPRLLGESRPAFMIECNGPALEAAGTTPAELFDILRSADYACYYLAAFAGECRPGEQIGELSATEFNFAAVPAEAVGGERWQRSRAAFALAGSAA